MINWKWGLEYKSCVLIQKGNDWYHAREIRSLVISSQLKQDFDFPFLKDLFDPYCLPCLPAHSHPWHVMNIYEHKWRIVLFCPPRLAGPAKVFYLNGCDLWWLLMCLWDCVSVGWARWMGAVMSEEMELLGRLAGLFCFCALVPGHLIAEWWLWLMSHAKHLFKGQPLCRQWPFAQTASPSAIVHFSGLPLT